MAFEAESKMAYPTIGFQVVAPGVEKVVEACLKPQCHIGDGLRTRGWREPQ
jgi:hypothetical protein